MKKTLTILTMTLFLFSCVHDDCNRHKALTHNFIEKFYTNDNISVDLEEIFEYTYIGTKDIDKLPEDKKQYANEYITEYIIFMRETFRGKKISLICYTEINFEEYKADEYTDFFEKMDIKDDTNIIFAISDRKILTFFIFDKNDKLISFFPDLWGSHFERKIIPIYLEKTLRDWL